MTVTLIIKHPAARHAKVREFGTLKDAATYGVAYYLADNGYATRTRAGEVAGDFLRYQEAAYDGITFCIRDEQVAA